MSCSATYLDRLKELNPAWHGQGRGSVHGCHAPQALPLSPAAFANTIGEHAKTIQNKGRKLSEERIADLIERADDSYDDDDEAAEAAAEAVRASSTVDQHRRRSARHARPASRRGERRIDPVRRAVSRHSPHSSTMCARPTTVIGAMDRLIVFTEYRDTHKWLGDMLKSAGVPKERIASMYGGMQPDQRSAVAQVFNRAPGDAHEPAARKAARPTSSGSPAAIGEFASSSPPTPLQRASTSSASVTISSTSTCPTTRPGWSSATGASTVTASSTPPPTSTRSRPIHRASLGRDTKLENDISEQARHRRRRRRLR